MEEIESKVEVITPEMAKEYLKLNNANRPLKKDIVLEYAEMMRKDQWRLNGEGICFLKNGTLSNGQHRLNAVIEYGKPVKFLVVRGCDNDSFLTYDNGKNRSLSDVFALSNIRNYSRVSSIVNKYVLLSKRRTIFSRHNSGGVNTRNIGYSKEDKLNEYLKNPELFQKALLLSEFCISKFKLMGPSDVGALFVFLVKDKNHSEHVVSSFFKMFFSGESIENKTISLLRDVIIKDGLSKRSLTGRFKEAIIAKTWNCYVLGKELKVLKWDEKTEGKIDYL